MKKIACYLLAILMLFLLVSCNKKQDASSPKTSRVSATSSFQKYFGPAPTTDKGTCYAFVIYFPSSKVPGKVIPFPFFTFDEASLKKVAVERLLGGMADLKSYRGEILQPFPAGSHLLGMTETGGVLTVNFSSELLASPGGTGDQALINALVLTLSQFSGVKEVRVQVDGKETALNKLPRPTGESVVLQPSQPRLLGITATKEKGAKTVEEVNAFFDRPVDIKALQMAGADGKLFQGDIYQSVFDMAGVLKPKEPTLFKAGMPIKVRWNVTDKLGRNAAGDAVVPLEIREH